MDIAYKINRRRKLAKRIFLTDENILKEESIPFQKGLQLSQNNTVKVASADFSVFLTKNLKETDIIVKEEIKITEDDEDTSHAVYSFHFYQMGHEADEIIWNIFLRKFDFSDCSYKEIELCYDSIYIEIEDNMKLASGRIGVKYLDKDKALYLIPKKAKEIFYDQESTTNG